MAERSMFWTTGTTGDGATTYTEAQLGEWLRDLFTPNSTIGAPHASQGVLRGAGGELAVSGAAGSVNVATGAAMTAGFFYRNDATVNVAIPTPAANTRVDRVVLRASHGTTRTVRITRIAGTEGAGAPALTQTAGTTWDIPLAQVSITTGGAITVTDGRTFAHYATAVSSAMLDDGAATTAKIADANVTAVKLASGAAVSNLGYTPWHAGNDGNASGLDADLLAGVNVEPIQRQGGNAANWSTVGTTNYSPTGIRTQVGKSDTLPGGSRTITFPVAFSAAPIVLVCIGDITSGISTSVGGITTTQANLRTYIGASLTGCGDVTWIAIGPA